jgi:hypothetical protein
MGEFGRSRATSVDRQPSEAELAGYAPDLTQKYRCEGTGVYNGGSRRPQRTSIVNAEGRK